MIPTIPLEPFEELWHPAKGFLRVMHPGKVQDCTLCARSLLKESK